MQVVLSRDFYQQIKFKRYIGEYAKKYELLTQEEILGLNQFQMERKLSDPEKFNNLKDFINDVNASYFIGSINNPDELKETSLKIDNNNLILLIEKDSLVLRSKYNSTLIGVDIIICID